jgi:predicted lysophospholipase L1 biosynthesis ABC-type transport system permease subunit
MPILAAAELSRGLIRIQPSTLENAPMTWRDGRGLAWFDRFSLDIKLAVRLLVRYPTLTLVATVSMAFGIATGVGSFEIRTQVVAPSIPLDEGSRIVGLRTWDTSRIRPIPPTPDDFTTWREALTLVGPERSNYLSAIYAVMAFTVARKTREIGIRMTLGADRRRVMGVVLRRPVTQVSIGIAVGTILVAVIFAGLNESAPTPLEAALIVGYSMLMMGVCLLACVVPTRRALRVEAADVLRVDA